MLYRHGTDETTVISNMIEVNFVDGDEDGFRKVKETLERMGVGKKHEKILYQSAHILYKRGRYYICHFKELYALDGKPAELTEEDIGRRNLIVRYLTDWGLVVPVVSQKHLAPMISTSLLKVIKYSEREDWTLKSKYNIGVLKRAETA